MMAYDMGVVKKAYDTALKNNASDKVMLALFQAGIVESGFRNLNYGDRDSIGFLQQRPSQGWGTVGQIMNVEYATNSFISRAKKIENNYKSSGKLAQAVQRSAFPFKYDLVESEAITLIKKVSGEKIDTEELGIIDFVKDPEGSLEIVFKKIVNSITGIWIYSIIIIFIFISIGMVYFQDEIKLGVKAGKKYISGGLL
jgi:hypothetical protein